MTPRAAALWAALAVGLAACPATAPEAAPEGIIEGVARGSPGPPRPALVAPPTSALELSFAADPADDPVGLEGATDLLVALLASEGEERAAAYGATLEAFREADRAGWRIRGPVAALERMATIVLDLAADPRLPGTELATRAARWRERLRVRPDATAEAARRWAAALVTGHGRPLGLEPTDGALATVNREDLVRLHRRLVRPDRWAVAASEPLGPALAARLAELARDAGGAPAAGPGPCPAPTGSAFRLAGGPPAVIAAAAAPAAERPAWAVALAALARYPSLQASARAEVRRLGADVVLVLTLPPGAAPEEGWAVIRTRLAALAPGVTLPPGLVAPSWLAVTVGGPTTGGRELSRDGAACRR